MQVSVISEPTTHAVVGGDVVGSFGIADSNEGFRIMSDTLYPDKPKAIVREYLCNAGDAHIAAGCTDKPIHVTLDRTHFKIRDHGPGIADDQIIGVFCTLFASTKRDKAAETGGFGLGSKAGFSYRDHFQVTSHHAGTKTVYLMHIGGKSTGGKPVCQRLVQVPTDETGIEISIELKSPEDGEKFRANVLRIVAEGGMNVLFNGEKVRTVDYGPIDKAGFGLLNNGSGYHSARNIYVRLGQVRYPLEAHREIDKARTDALSHIPLRYDLVLVLPPGSVRPVPSRESLSYEEDTIATLNSALTRFSRHVSQAKKKAIKEFAALRVTGDSAFTAAVTAFRPSVKELEQQSLADVVADYDEIGRINACHAGVPLSAIRPFWLRKYHSHRKLWRRHQNFDVQEFTLTKLLRIARTIGAESQLRIRTGEYNALEVLERARVPENSWVEMDKNPHRRRQRFFEKLTEIKLHICDGPHGSSAHGQGFYLVRKGITAEERAIVLAACKKHGIGAVEVKKPEPVKREKKPKIEKPKPTAPVYPVATFNIDDRIGTQVGGSMSIYSTKQVETSEPKALIYISQAQRYFRTGYLIPTATATAFNQVAEFLPNVAIASSQGTLSRLAELKVPHFFDALLSHLATTIRRPSLRVRRIVQAAVIDDLGVHDSNISGRLFNHSLKGAMSLVGVFRETTQEDESLFRLWRASSILLNCDDWRRSEIANSARSFQDNYKALLENVDASPSDNPIAKAIIEPPPHLCPLQNIVGRRNSVPAISDEMLAELLPIIEFNYRRLQKQKEAA